MINTYSLEQIKKAVGSLELSASISKGFVEYSNGKAIVPPVGELLFIVHPMPSPAAAANKCNLIITTTPSRAPLLFETDIEPGTHITAIGSDTPEKQELAPGILQKADTIVTDSLSQCRQRGEIYKAIQYGVIDGENILELGNIIQNFDQVKRANGSISVADLTGVAVQDIQIATAVCRALEQAQ